MYLRKMKRAISVLLLSVFLTAGFAPSASASIAAKVISASRVYKKASTKAASKRVPKNVRVSITAIKGKWAKVNYKGKSVYIPFKKLKPTQRAKGYTKKATSVYTSSGKKQGKLSKGTGVYVLGTIGGYYCVANSAGKVGYVKPGTLSKTKPSITNVTKTRVISKMDKALATARSLLGRRYSMSDNPPSSFNCSSFVQYCMEKAGYPMKGTAQLQSTDSRYSKIGSISSLKKGDILFFDTTGNGRVDHSAIYLGGSVFVEASQNAGKVHVNTMTSWYKRHFMWARRPA